MNVQDVRADLIAEQDALDSIVADLSLQQWALPTPSPRWSVADQIGHLTYFDWTATAAITDPERFQDLASELMSSFSPDSGEDVGDRITLTRYRSMASAELLDAWRTNRAALAEASAGLTDEDRVIWYGPSMGAKSFLTARLMEAWAHGQDIVDTLGVERPFSDRIRHIAQLGFITRKWSYLNRQLEVPSTPVQVSLETPSGEVWHFGPTDATDTISGPATDFCLVVTQRRHVDDTELVVTEGPARDWMEKAQIFAGPATDGPVAGTF